MATPRSAAKSGGGEMRPDGLLQPVTSVNTDLRLACANAAETPASRAISVDDERAVRHDEADGRVDRGLIEGAQRQFMTTDRIRILRTGVITDVASSSRYALRRSRPSSRREHRQGPNRAPLVKRGPDRDTRLLHARADSARGAVFPALPGLLHITRRLALPRVPPARRGRRQPHVMTPSSAMRDVRRR